VALAAEAKIARVLMAPSMRAGLIARGLQRLSDGAFAEAESVARQLIEADPQDFDALHLAGVAALRQGDYATALAHIAKAVHRRPGDAQAQQNLGALWARQGRLAEAETCFRHALALDPNLTDAHANLGLALANQGRAREAIGCYRRALALDPRHAEAWNRLGLALARERKLTEAIPCFRQALAIRPGYGEALANLYHQLQHACDWAELPFLGARLDRATTLSLSRGQRPAEPPFVSVARSMDPARNCAVATAASDELMQRMATPVVDFHTARPPGRRKILLGYLSGDYRNHPLTHLLGGLFARHDRERFEVRAYSYGPDDGSRYRRRAEGEADRFVDLCRLSALDAARQIHADEVDILIDLTGRTGDHRLGICALHPAPVQVAWLGFPGTSGARFMDYAIVDRVVAPPEDAASFVEKLVWLPHCYQINDAHQPISAKPITRAEAGLPPDGFVFACFANGFKIEAPVFAVWMSLLRQVPGGVLWLLRNNDLMERNLKQAAVARGIDPARLIFADKVAKEEHLARLRLADLALDTRLYTGHTTTSDALWAGLPVVAMIGGHFASRVSTSILMAAGLPELVTASLADYEALALRLAHEPTLLAELKGKLARNQASLPLFDSRRFIRNLESAYEAMWRRFTAGELPAAFAVAD
jgi:protein O-GlcNAc transferase